LENIEQELIKIFESRQPETLEEAIRLASLKFSESYDSIMERILGLEREGKISFEKPITMSISSFITYLFSGRSHWFWIIFGLAIVASFVVFVVPENSFPFMYIRYFFGSLLVLFLPGYTFLKGSFKLQDLGIIESFALSLVLSLAIVSLVGLLLNYTQWGIRVEPVTSCLFAFVFVFSFLGVVRDYGEQKNR